MLGPEQGGQLEERLRLDSLSINAEAATPTSDKHKDSAATSSSADCLPPPEPQQPRESDCRVKRSGHAAPGKKSVIRPTTVPDHRLPEIKDKVSVFDGVQCAGIRSWKNLGLSKLQPNGVFVAQLKQPEAACSYR